ncbi:MAG: uroporphyrinogen decarboxylase family protein [Candidatus Margulisiibacteriota bacterium]
MKVDVLAWAEGTRPGKMISKETLNHPELIRMISGLDVYQHTRESYLRAYQALGIDLINRVPMDNAPLPTLVGQTRSHPTLPYNFSSLGVFDTAMRHTYACRDPDDVWRLDMSGIRLEDLIVPVPHACNAEDIRLREAALGDIGVYYPMCYTTLFMWAVEVLGWETFMMAAATDPQRFHEHFLLPCVEKSKAIVRQMAAASQCPFVFLHDDVAGAAGPMLRLSWYDDFVFPHYPEIFAEAKRLGKRVIVVADGNMSAFLGRLVDAGVDGLMFENPATPLEPIIEHFGRTGMFLIGGIDTAVLTAGNPNQIRRMVLELAKKMENCPGFAMSSCGGLHANIPLENLAAYFDARAEIGATPKDWRSRCHVEESDSCLPVAVESRILGSL